VPLFPGYSGDVKTADDFAKCGTARRMAIMASLARLMETYTTNLEKADERLAEAARAVAIEQERIAEERTFLGAIAATYVEFSQVVAASAIEAASAGETTEMTKLALADPPFNRRPEPRDLTLEKRESHLWPPFSRIEASHFFLAGQILCSGSHQSARMMLPAWMHQTRFGPVSRKLISSSTSSRLIAANRSRASLQMSLTAIGCDPVFMMSFQFFASNS
jgi:hypothetical protein